MASMQQVFKDSSVKKLYKDLMRLAQYMGSRNGGNAGPLREQVRQAFKANMRELDEEKIVEQKEAALRALGNFYFSEAERLARDRKPGAGPAGGPIGGGPFPPGMPGGGGGGAPGAKR
jgi:hypothetical protein